MMAYRAKSCLVCGKEYQPASSRNKYCPECAPVMKKTRKAKWAKDNSEKRKASAKASRRINPEKNRASVAKWARENPEKVREKNAKWDRENPDKRKASSRASCAKWYKANPEKDAIHGSKRRAAKYSNTPIDEMLTSTEWLAILEEAQGCCHYCGREAKLTLDHVIPLSRGGKHSKENVVPACGHCNSSKHDKTVEAWNTSQRAQLEAAR